jgi:hypothetical protein
MTSSVSVTTLDCTRHCPVCNNHMDLDEIGIVPWASHTTGERQTFRCSKCGMVRSEWNEVPMIHSPGADLVPEEMPAIVRAAVKLRSKLPGR